MKKLFLLISLVFIISACDINPSKFGRDEANEMASNLTYTKDNRTGLCFAFVASRKTGNLSQTGMAMTEIDCDKVKTFLEY